MALNITFKFGVIDYSYINGVYTKIVNQIENNSY